MSFVNTRTRGRSENESLNFYQSHSEVNRSFVSSFIGFHYTDHVKLKDASEDTSAIEI